jgi:hypothetical protein
LYDKEFENKPEKMTWTSNPKFLLRLTSEHEVPIKITVSRPEKAWKKAIGMNMVGCMLGFYVYPAND